MDVLDWVHLVFVFVALAAVVAHMNNMKWGTTPLLEMFGWWLFGVGLGGELIWHVYTLSLGLSLDLSDSHMFLSTGSALLGILYSQPEWRPLFADRRKNAKGEMPPNCDRRCQRMLDLRITRS